MTAAEPPQEPPQTGPGGLLPGQIPVPMFMNAGPQVAVTYSDFRYPDGSPGLLAVFQIGRATMAVEFDVQMGEGMLAKLRDVFGSGLAVVRDMPAPPDGMWPRPTGVG